MKDIFSELYNKVMSFFVAPQESDPSKEKALSRLKVVLMQDRVGFSERAMQMMKEDIVDAISKYLEIDEDLFELQLDAKEEKTMLMLTIPVNRAKTDEEIDEALKILAEKNQVKAESLVQELEEIIEERAQVLAGEMIENKDADADVDTDSDVEDADETDEEPETDEGLASEECLCEDKPKRKSEIKKNAVNT